jgi:hypothetical protein
MEGIYRHGRLPTLGQDLLEEGKPSQLAYFCEHVDIGPVNHCYKLEVPIQKLCIISVLIPHKSCCYCGYRKEQANAAWFSEPHND